MWTWGPWFAGCSFKSCPTVLCSVPAGASGSQAFNLLQPWICPRHQISSNLKRAGVKGKWLQSALLIELRWPFCNKRLFKKHRWMSNDAFFFRREGRRVQSTLLHLDGDVEQVVVAFTPTQIQQYFECWRRKTHCKQFKGRVWSIRSRGCMWFLLIVYHLEAETSTQKHIIRWDHTDCSACCCFTSMSPP